MQGRLVPSVNGELQSSPGPRWRDELHIAAGIGLSHIELVADRSLDPSNPIWHRDGRRELVDLSAATGVAVKSICVNETLASPFDRPELATSVVGRLTPVVRELGLILVVLPLLEGSNLRSLDWGCVARSVGVLADALAGEGARLCLEVDVAAADALSFLGQLREESVAVCYDLGNASALGFDCPGELRALDRRVGHVHAKDRDPAGRNVRFGKGTVPWVHVVEALREIDYHGLVTMEAIRGDDPAMTAAEHRDFLLAASSRSSSR